MYRWRWRKLLCQAIPIKPIPIGLILFISVCVSYVIYCGSSVPKVNSSPFRKDLPKESWDSLNYVVGPPKEQYKDNLRKDTFYITSWSNAGFTNQFMSYVNMIYLGIISERVPIVPPFSPDHHISSSAGSLPFGKIFNLTELRRSLRKPVLEWSDVKILEPPLPNSSIPVERTGCWSTRPQNENEPIRAERLLHHLGLDVSYTRVPPRTRLDRTLAIDAHIAFFPLAEVIDPKYPNDIPGDKYIMSPSLLGSELDPDHHMACFDLMYYASAGTKPYEWKYQWSPAWRFVGKSLKFTDSVMDIAKEYARKALQASTHNIPLFIAVHVRRGDFAYQCFDVPSDCLAPLSAYVRRVKEVQGLLFVKHGIKASKVLLTSDEKDPLFWEQVSAEGWKYIDHAAEQTLERYGEWYLPLIDIVAQSLAVGFVGSIDSTVSIVSARRVEDWNEGVTRVVSWGGREEQQDFINNA